MVTLLLPQTKTTMGKSNHFSGQPIAEPYFLASVNFYRTAIIKYMNSDAFAPSATLNWNEINRLVQEDSK